jgi:hypothetical protein
MKMRVALATMACGVALATSDMAAQADSALCPATGGTLGPHLATLADFAWLKGTWRGDGPGGATAEIHYLAPRANVLPSFFWLWTEERVVVLEAITLVQGDDGITLYVRHFSPVLEPLEAERALALTLEARHGERFFFRNIYDENPRCTVLERTSEVGFRASSQLLRSDGTMDEIRVEYRRVNR